VRSWITTSPNLSWFKNGTLDAPLVHVYPYTQQVPNYEYWACKGISYKTELFSPLPDSPSPDPILGGVCLAGSLYAWGFSFILSMIVACINFAFVLVMCLIWLCTREKSTGGAERSPRKERDDIIVNVLLISSQAQSCYGSEVADWDACTVKKRIWKGRKGMTFMGKGDRNHA
jgi:hypothetical protein